VTGLKENGEYKFRVSAFNAIGVSDPLVGHNIIAKNPMGKGILINIDERSLNKSCVNFIEPPFLDKTGLKNLKVHVGDAIKYDLKIGGNPTPEVFWFVNDKPLTPGGRVKVVVQSYNVCLKVITIAFSGAC